MSNPEDTALTVQQASRMAQFCKVLIYRLVSSRALSPEIVFMSGSLTG
jgi:hypothetical protein